MRQRYTWLKGRDIFAKQIFVVDSSKNCDFCEIYICDIGSFKGDFSEFIFAMDKFESSHRETIMKKNR